MDLHLFAYYFFIFSGAFVSYIVGYKIGIKKGLQKSFCRGIMLYACIAGVFAALLMGKIQSSVISLTPLPNYPNRFRIFGLLLFLPPLMYIPVRLTGGDMRKITDIVTPGTFLVLGCSKIGCAAYGCCYGIDFLYGIHSRFSDSLVFPVQFTESLMCFLLFFLMYFLVTKEKCRKGTAYPVSLFLYGILRFFVEFLRHYTPEEKTYFFGINFWQLVCIISIVYALALYVYVSRKSPGIEK